VAGIRVTGEAQVIAALRALQFEIREKAIKKAAMKGAEIAKAAIERTAPSNKDRGNLSKYIDREHTKLRHEPIKDSIIIYRRRRSQEQQGDSISYLVGPNKKAGFHGYFIEHGIAGGRRVGAREFVDRAYKQSKDQINRAVIDALKEAVKAE
jgi:HK97 gp10 family phage protein